MGRREVERGKVMVEVWWKEDGEGREGGRMDE
jgi:hypothetical protein